MNCIILAAGYGTRLGNLTKNTPKCLLKIKGETLLLNWIKKLEKLNIKNIIINTHYLHYKVYEFIQNLESPINITLSYEKNLLGTAHTLKKNLKYLLNDECLFLHADNYTKDDLSEFIKYNNKRPASCIITMYGFKTDDYKNSGIVITDEQSIVTDIYEKRNIKYGAWANGAILILSKKFMNNYDNYYTKKSYDFCKDILPKLKNEIFFYKSKSELLDIGIKTNFRKLNA